MLSTVKKCTIGVILALTLPLTAVTALPASAAAHATKCISYGGPHDDCTTVTRTKDTKTRMARFRVTNHKKSTATMSCNVTKTYTSSYAVTTTAGVNVTASAEVGAVFGLAKIALSASASASVSKSLTSTEATSQGGSAIYKIKPGKSLTCDLYIHDYEFTVKRTYWESRGGKLTKTVKSYDATIPNYFELVAS